MTEGPPACWSRKSVTSYTSPAIIIQHDSRVECCATSWAVSISLFATSRKILGWLGYICITTARLPIVLHLFFFPIMLLDPCGTAGPSGIHRLLSSRRRRAGWRDVCNPSDRRVLMEIYCTWENWTWYCGQTKSTKCKQRFQPQNRYPRSKRLWALAFHGVANIWGQITRKRRVLSIAMVSMAALVWRSIINGNLL